jgi:uncharacterized protein (DUF952 family)
VRRIFHIVARTDWDRTGAGPYRAPALETDGFIHCSNRDQVEGVANQFYADQADLLVLCIDADRLTAPVRDEDPGTGERFPHVYGPIEREAVVEVRELARGPDGAWRFP